MRRWCLGFVFVPLLPPPPAFFSPWKTSTESIILLFRPECDCTWWRKRSRFHPTKTKHFVTSFPWLQYCQKPQHVDRVNHNIKDTNNHAIARSTRVAQNRFLNKACPLLKPIHSDLATPIMSMKYTEYSWMTRFWHAVKEVTCIFIMEKRKRKSRAKSQFTAIYDFV